jgi:hypothetical protein
VDALKGEHNRLSGLVAYLVNHLRIKCCDTLDIYIMSPYTHSPLSFEPQTEVSLVTGKTVADLNLKVGVPILMVICRPARIKLGSFHTIVLITLLCPWKGKMIPIINHKAFKHCLVSLGTGDRYVVSIPVSMYIAFSWECEATWHVILMRHYIYNDSLRPSS